MTLKGTFQRQAFTLIEIMVAVSLFAILVASVYSTWVLLLKTSKVAQEATARVQRQRIAVRTIEDSLTCMQSFQGSIQYYSFIVQNGDQPTLSFVARLPDTFLRNGRFNSNLRRLTFTVEADTDAGGKNQVLRQNEILKDTDADEQAAPLVLAHNVKDFVVECWDTKALEWAQEWVNTNAIPPIVRVTLTLLSNNNSPDSTVSISREIAVPSVIVPIADQTPGGARGGGPLQGLLPGGGGGGGGGNGAKGQNPNGVYQRPTPDSSPHGRQP